MTVGRLLGEMSGPEFDLWREWYVRHGFDADRIEATTAKAGAYVGGVWGGKATPNQLVARFGRRDDRAEFERLKSFFTRAAARQRKKETGGEQ